VSASNILQHLKFLITVLPVSEQLA